MKECKWMHIPSRTPLSKSELIAELDQKKNGVAILSGPSGCGKTVLLQEMRCYTHTPMFIYTCEQVADSILSVARGGCLSEGVPIFEKHPMHTILAIEDADYYLAGREDTRHLVYANIKRIAQESLVVLTGIDIELKMADLFHYFPEVDFYCAMNENTEFWDLYDEHGNKLPHRFHLRGRPVPEGCYHLVVNVLIRDRQCRYLMGQRSADRKSFPQMWEGCGGSVTMGETPLQTAVRESHEELFCLLSPNDAKLIDTQVRENKWGRPYRDILFTYLFEVDEIVWRHEEAPTKEEVAASGLFTLSQIRVLQERNQLHPDLDYIFDLLE